MNAVLFGSSTVNKRIMNATGGIFEILKSIGFKNKKIEALEIALKVAKLEVIEGGVKELYNLDKETLERCKDFGKSFAEKL